MPVAASRKQYRMMMAILHGSVKPHSRGRPPKSVAAKYTDPGKDAPESKDNDRGGTWTEEHHKRHAKGHKMHRGEGRKHEKDSNHEHHLNDNWHKHHGKKHLKKAFEEFYKGKGRFAATLTMDGQNRVLLGTHGKGGLAFPGGHVETGESFEDAALRELQEETGAIGRLLGTVWEGTTEGNDGIVYLAEIAAKHPEDTEEIKNWKWYEIDEIPWSKLRSCCAPPLKEFIGKRFGKSIRGMLALEVLEKAKEKDDGNIEPDHKNALKLVGVGIYRHLKDVVKGMGDESFKEVDFDTYKVSLRKHTDGTFSGRVQDGHKVVYQFTNKSLHELAAALMSVFEWFLPEDADVLDMVSDESISDDAVKGGLQHLVENYKRHNLGEIYQEMETIREHIRGGVAVDLQQVEGKILKLFDRLEEATHNIEEKHNKLAQEVGKDMDELEAKLRELQSKLNESPKGKTVEAFSADPADDKKVHSRLYSYLSKPIVEIQPTGKITIRFGEDWDDLERGNFLEDLRAKALKR